MLQMTIEGKKRVYHEHDKQLIFQKKTLKFMNKME